MLMISYRCFPVGSHGFNFMTNKIHKGNLKERHLDEPSLADLTSCK
jgi:hypothetical protein